MANTGRYLRFIELFSEINKKYDLSSREISLMNLVYLSESNTQVLQVKDLLCQSKIGSQATIHSSIKRLIHKKLLKAVPSKDDQRVKFVELTNIAKTRYKKIEEIISGNK